MTETLTDAQKAHVEIVRGLKMIASGIGMIVAAYIRLHLAGLKIS